MVNIEGIKIGQKLVVVEVSYGREVALVGPVTFIDRERNEIAIRIGRDHRSFPVGILGYDPRDEKTTTNKPTKNRIDEKLMGFIVGINDGQVGTIGLREVADVFKKHGVKPIKAQELIAVL